MSSNRSSFKSEDTSNTGLSVLTDADDRGRKYSMKSTVIQLHSIFDSYTNDLHLTDTTVSFSPCITFRYLFFPCLFLSLISLNVSSTLVP
jgi:hypothetical protein